jgi:hypothetical protein
VSDPHGGWFPEDQHARRTPATEAGRALVNSTYQEADPVVYTESHQRNREALIQIVLDIEAAARADAERRVTALREALEVAADRLETMPDYPPEAVRQAAYFGSEDARYALADLDAMEATA